MWTHGLILKDNRNYCAALEELVVNRQGNKNVWHNSANEGKTKNEL